MKNKNYHMFINHITNIFQKKSQEKIQHGLGIGLSNSSEDIAITYLLKGVGIYKPEPTHKLLLPDLDIIIVKLAWKANDEWVRNVFYENCGVWSNEDEDSAIFEWRDQKYPERKGQMYTDDDRDEWYHDVIPEAPNAKHINQHYMIDVVFKGKFEPQCLELDKCYYKHAERDKDTFKLVFSDVLKPKNIYKNEHCNSKCRSSEHFGFKCVCTDHGGGFKKV